MLYSKFLPLFVTAVGGTAALTVDHTLFERDLQARATVNGSCISAPDTSCVSLVGLCVTNIASGQTPATQFWSDPICTAAATCAGMGPVLDAACCAGTCHQPTDMASLDYDNIYFGMVGECAFQPGGCSLTWQPFVDWFYNTIQATNTNIWPESGDVVLDWWASIATWTAFCEGDNCVDSAIPYTNLDDWFHYSSAVIVTSPGTPMYVEPLSTDSALNDDDWTPDFSWPCSFDNSTDCWWDYGPPTTASSSTSERRDVEVHMMKPRKFALAGNRTLTKLAVKAAGNASNPYQVFGRAKNQPANVPPSTYVLGQPLVLHLNGTHYTPPSSPRSVVRDVLAISPATLPRNMENRTGNTIVPRTITPDQCAGPVDTPVTLPTLKYYCNLLPNICANIRSHPDFVGNSMVLTYDPFGSDARRDSVCTVATKATYQAAGKCDRRQHNPAFWKVSCDEFPFNAALEGGLGNAVTMAVPMREQGYQGTLQSSITNLRRLANDGRTVWKGSTGRMCHSYQIELLASPEAGAPPSAVGNLDAGSAFFSSGMGGSRFITDSRVTSRPMPPPFATDTDYPSTASNLHVPSIRRDFDCRPCTIGFVPAPPPAVDDEEDLKEEASVAAVEEGEDEPTPSPTTPPTKRHRALDKRASSSCTLTTTTVLATSTPEATQVATDDIAAAVAAAAAAAAAASAATDASPPEASAASTAVTAASALSPAAAALTDSVSDTSFAAAIAAAEAAIEAAQDAAAAVYALGPGTPDSVTSVADQVISASSSITDAMQNVQNVIPPQTPIPPDTDPAKNPNVNLGPPPNTPAAACFGAGSTGFLKIGDSYLVNESGKAPATLVDVGSDAFFGLTFPDDCKLLPVDGCTGVYAWANDKPLAPDFQVDCSTLEFGSYWNGVKQACYAYSTSPEVFDVFCGNNLGSIYSCLQGAGLYGTLNPAFFSWATS